MRARASVHVCACERAFCVPVRDFPCAHLSWQHLEVLEEGDVDPLGLKLVQGRLLKRLIASIKVRGWVGGWMGGAKRGGRRRGRCAHLF